LSAGEITAQEWIGRVRLAAACRLMAKLGWEEPLITQVTLRVPGSHGPVIFVPAFGVPLSEVGVSDLVRIGPDGNALEPLHGERADGATPSIDLAGLRLHLALYAARSDVHCVLRIHTPAALAVACQGEGLRIDNAWGAQLAGRIASHDFGGLDFEETECADVVKDLGSREVLILRSYGFLVVGSGLESAWHTLSVLEHSLEAQVATESMSGANEPLTPTMARRCAETFLTLDPRVVEMGFDRALGGAAIRLADVLA
jgi:ribulose-5-phosphate 4-epimerase/fuculose-1-phosphate aldolase